MQVSDLCPWAVRRQRKVCSRTADSLMSLKGYSDGRVKSELQVGVEIAQRPVVGESSHGQQQGHSRD